MSQLGTGAPGEQCRDVCSYVLGRRQSMAAQVVQSLRELSRLRLVPESWQAQVNDERERLQEVLRILTRPTVTHQKVTALEREFAASVALSQRMSLKKSEIEEQW